MWAVQNPSHTLFVDLDLVYSFLLGRRKKAQG